MKRQFTYNTFFKGLCMLCVILHSCYPNKNEIIGKYAAVGYVNTYDTIIIFPKGVFEQRVYDKKSNDLALQFKGEWEYENGELTMYPFFFDFDRDIVLYPELLKDTMSMSVIVEKRLGDISFCTGYYENENCLEK